jgi:hypothetical protein
MLGSQSKSKMINGAFASNKRPFILPLIERQRIVKEQEKAIALKAKIQEENEVRFRMQELERMDAVISKEKKNKTSISTSDNNVISKVDKLQHTPSQLKAVIERHNTSIKEQEQLQELLNEKPMKPAQKLLNKLVKKHKREKVSKKLRDKVESIKRVENRIEEETRSSNKILDAIKSAF